MKLFTKFDVFTKKNQILLKNIHVIDGNGSELFNQNVLIEEGKIKRITKDNILVRRATVIMGEGKTLMPGLIDSHTHLQGISNRSEEESDNYLINMVPSIFKDNIFPYGITTIKELGDPRHFIYKLKEKIESGEIEGPRLLVVGPNITAKGGHPAITLGGDNPWMRKELAAEVSTVDEAKAIVRELANNYVDFLKIVYQGGQYFYFDRELDIKKLSIDLVKVIIEEGNKCGLKTTAHVWKKNDVEELLHTELYGIEHGIIDQDIQADDAILSLWKEQGAYYVPTVNALTYEHDKTLFEHSMHNLKYIFDAGVKIVLGTDNMLEALSGDVVHNELSYYVQAGLTPMQAIVAATGNGAKYLGISSETGTVEVGKNADLILLNSNPLTDIKNVKDIEMVWKQGKVVYAKSSQANVSLPDYEYSDDELFSYSDGLHKIDGKPAIKKMKFTNQEESNKVSIDCYYNDKICIQENFNCEKNLITKSWSYLNETTGNHLQGIMQQNTVVLSGEFGKKQVDRKYDMNGKIWMQMGEWNLCTFALSEEKEIHYYSIGTGNNRGALEMTEFTSKKEEAESIQVNGVSYECIKISTVLSKYPFIWTGYNWYEKQTGKLMVSMTKGNQEDKIELL